MKLVKEELDFKRGQDPHQSLNIGKYDDTYDFMDPKRDDKIELQVDIYDTQYMGKGVLNYNGESLTTMDELLSNMEIKFEKSLIFQFDDDVMDWFILNGDDYINMHWVIQYNSSFKKLR